MQDPDEIRRRKRRCNRAVLGGLALLAVALLTSGLHLLPDLVTTLAAIAGVGSVMYGVNGAWLIVYERDSDGPPV